MLPEHPVLPERPVHPARPVLLTRPAHPLISMTDLPVDVVYAGREILGELKTAESREILLTNGIGGYASMTLANSLTRSYHGLLIAALRPPLDRTLLLTKLNETVLYNQKSYHLATDRRKEHAVKKQTIVKRFSSNASIPGQLDGNIAVRAGGTLDETGSFCPIWRSPCTPSASQLKKDEVVSPPGFELLESFHLDGAVPTFVYSFADALLEKKLWMKHGYNTVYVTYYLRRAVHAIELRLKALVNHRNHHRRTTANHPHFDYSANVGEDGATVSVLFTAPNQQHTNLCMRVSRGHADLTNEWVTGFVLNEERARGLPDVDDNLHVATFVAELPPGGRLTFVASAEPDISTLSLNGEAELGMRHAYEKSLLQKFEDARENEFKRVVERDRCAQKCVDGLVYSPTSVSPGEMAQRRRRSVEPCIKQLVLAADQFIITRGGGRSVVAGFPWFTDWARDVRHSLIRGLTLFFYLLLFSLLSSFSLLIFFISVFLFLKTMISLPGLTIAMGRYDVARSIIQTFSKYGKLCTWQSLRHSNAILPPDIILPLIYVDD